MKANCCMLALLCLAAIVGRSSAQDVVPSQVQPGVFQSGRFFGFVPKHEQLLEGHGIASTKQARTSDLVSRTNIASFLPSGVQQASYTESPRFDGVTETAIASPCNCPTPCAGPCPKWLLWGSGEYLHWWTGGVDVPSLATASPEGTSQSDAGVLPAASSLFGGDQLHDDGRSGGRFSLGMWFSPQRSSGLEFSFVYLQEDGISFAASGADFPILARPFLNVQSGANDARLIAFDGLVDGDLSISSEVDFHAYEIQLRRPASQLFGARTDWLFGFRRARLDDIVRIDERTESLSGPTLGTTFDLFDQFAAENEFQGCQVGIQYQGPAINCWSLGLLAKVAVGYNDSQVFVNGETTTTTETGDATTNPGGLLTQASNIGNFDDDEFSTLSEFRVSMARQLNRRLSLNVGYTLLHWTEVARSAGQIDLGVNPTQIPPGTLSGDARPRVPFHRSDFTAQGLSLGIEYRY